MSIIKGCIFNITRFSINDGPGIRTTVFLKGCPLHCEWCHNPESISPFPQLLYRSEKCIDCGRCLNSCSKGCHYMQNGSHLINIKDCIACGLCCFSCPVNALEICGKYVFADEIIEEVKKDTSFYNTSSGGMTISGGEPLSQVAFTKELLKLAKSQNIHTCIETSGMCDQKSLAEIAKDTDLFLFDYKHSNSLQLEKYTGAIYGTIYENLELLQKLNKAVILRCPIIPDINDTYTHYDEIIKIATTFSNIVEINILPYHSFGEQKNKLIPSQVNKQLFRAPSNEEVSNCLNYLKLSISKIPIKL